jgi:hypothetical protein
MSHSSLDSPTEILRSTVEPPPYTPPPPTTLSHEQRLQWRENAKELMDTTLDKWTYPSIPLTTIEDIRNSAKVAARLAKIWALAQSDPTQRDSADVKYHMERLWQHFEDANKAAAAHSQAAWEYPLNLASRLHDKMNEEPGRSTVDIVVHKFQHLRKDKESDEFIAVDNPDVISFVPILDSSTYSHGLGTNRYSFKVEYHSRSPSPLGTPRIPLVSPILQSPTREVDTLSPVPRSPSYHVTTPSPLLQQRIRSPTPPIVIMGADQEVVNSSARYAHPGPPFIKNRLDGRFCITTPIRNANNNKGKAKFVRFILDDASPRAHLTMGKGHPVFAIKLRARPRDGTQTPFDPFRQRIFEAGHAYQPIVDRAIQQLGDPFIKGEVSQFRHLTHELQEARQEVVDARTSVRHAQQVEILATSALAAARQAVDASIDRFEQAGAYRTLHPFLFRQALRHVGDDDAMVDARDHLYCQLQAGGRPTSPSPSTPAASPPNIDDILARFDDTPMRDMHDEPFFQDGGDDDEYYE